MVGLSIDFSSMRHAVQPAHCSRVRLRRELLLTLRAPEGGAAVLGKTLDDAPAARGLTFLAFTVVDLERMLEVAEFARSLAVVAQRGAAGLDRLIEHGMD